MQSAHASLKQVLCHYMASICVQQQWQATQHTCRLPRGELTTEVQQRVYVLTSWYCWTSLKVCTAVDCVLRLHDWPLFKLSTM
jgi:hypothetical protein